MKLIDLSEFEQSAAARGNPHMCWGTCLCRALMDAKETPTSIIATTLTDDELRRQFYAGYGGTQGCSFTAWSERRVYFPVCYDGAEWVESVPRNPCDEKTEHMGGGG